LNYDKAGKAILDKFSDIEEGGGNALHFCVNYNLPGKLNRNKHKK